VLKKAIEFLSRQQREQQTVIVDLIESLKERTVQVPTARKSFDVKSDRSEIKPVVEERVEVS